VRCEEDLGGAKKTKTYKPSLGPAASSPAGQHIVYKKKRYILFIKNKT
tara:strand:+ start:34 stop:177 length:144 start_codon:yes stop_codon:yes gene_type:complete